MTLCKSPGTLDRGEVAALALEMVCTPSCAAYLGRVLRGPLITTVLHSRC
jgi:hypothetical protein